MMSEDVDFEITAGSCALWWNVVSVQLKTWQWQANNMWYWMNHVVYHYKNHTWFPTLDLASKLHQFRYAGPQKMFIPTMASPINVSSRIKSRQSQYTRPSCQVLRHLLYPAQGIQHVVEQCLITSRHGNATLSLCFLYEDYGRACVSGGIPPQ